ncbi:MAG TPA: homocysteine S-methyltransferase family protein [Spirochaetota bacterium]|mgnify:CR=1 FL=1|nr:homocysteine S-methyltransferase family protein [Spirochaetota bacterium]
MTREEFAQLCLNKTVILDGSTGIELIRRKMKVSGSIETSILDSPDMLNELQLQYCKAGADIILTPTLGANRVKLQEYSFDGSVRELNRELASLSLKTASSFPTKVFGDISSTGRFIEPFGDLLFDDAVEYFREQAEGLLEAGVNGFFIETMIDLQEARAALIAVRELCDLPAVVCLSFYKEGYTLNGSSPQSVVVTLQSLGADAVGCNCSTGPAEMIPIIQKMATCTKLPLVVKPNAGLPSLKNGKTVYSMDKNEFLSYIPNFHKLGVSLIGGCCGTDPGFINDIAVQWSNKVPVKRESFITHAIASNRTITRFGAGSFTLIGERINPTGKKDFQKQLREKDLTTIEIFASKQQEFGANVLDVNMGLSGIDEREMMLKTISLLSRISSLPLCIDSTRPEVIESALRLYPGRALVNSISGEKDRLEITLPIAAKYGAMLIILPLDDNGIPVTFEERVLVIRKIIDEATKYGYTTDDMVIDGLVMTISSDQKAAKTTLDLINWCAKNGINSVCGLSNVSFGLPQRDIVNSAFLALGAQRGLTSAIANPSSERLRNIISSINKKGCRI